MAAHLRSFCMHRTPSTAALAIALAIASAACESTSPARPSDLAANQPGLFATPTGNASLKAGVPVAVTPVGNVVTTSLTPTFAVSGGQLLYSTDAVQYRFRVVDATGAVTADSGLQNGPSWTPAVPLTPTSVYSWIARAEYRGGTGPWSTSAFFSTPVAPGNDYGAWESTCQGLVPDGPAVSNCVWQFVRPTNSFTGLELVKRVAWLLRGQGAGLLRKDGGENIAQWLGMSFSSSRICFKDGHIYKLLGDAGPGGANTAGWSDNDFVDVALYVPAIDPRLR
jgi:hypothetical protein